MGMDYPAGKQTRPRPEKGGIVTVVIDGAGGERSGIMAKCRWFSWRRRGTCEFTVDVIVTISGAPYRVNVPVALKNFHVRGEPTPYRKVGDSGGLVVTNFCSATGGLVAEGPRFLSFSHAMGYGHPGGGQSSHLTNGRLLKADPAVVLKGGGTV
eukprot:gene19233-19618_t